MRRLAPLFLAIIAIFCCHAKSGRVSRWFGRRQAPFAFERTPLESAADLRGGSSSSLETSQPWWVEQNGKRPQRQPGKDSNGVLSPTSRLREETEEAPWWTESDGKSSRAVVPERSGSRGAVKQSGRGGRFDLGSLTQGNNPWMLLLAAPAVIFAGGVTHGVATSPKGGGSGGGGGGSGPLRTTKATHKSGGKKQQERSGGWTRSRNVRAASAASPPSPIRRRTTAAGTPFGPQSLSPARQADLSTAGVLAAAAGTTWWIYSLYVTNALISSWRLPFLEPWQALALTTWAFNMFAVGQRGRIDGSQARAATASGGSSKNSGVGDDVRFFTPAGWAFGIWGPIFLGEFLYIVYQSLPNSAFWLADLSPFFAGAMAAQVLWCYAFRPWAADNGRLWLPASMLSVGALCLAGAHRVLRAATREGDLSWLQYAIVHVPISLHFGWLSAASLVSWNGWAAALPKVSPGSRLALSALSCYAALALGITVSVRTGDPIYALVLAWALTAVADAKGWAKLKNLVDGSVTDAQSVTARICAGGLGTMAVVMLGMELFSRIRGIV